MSFMDANEKIPVVSKFEFPEVGQLEKEEVIRVYEVLAEWLWKRFDGNIKFQSGLRSRMQELPLKVDYLDASYLHVLVTSHYTVGARAVWSGLDIQEVLDSEQYKTEAEIQSELDEGFTEAVKHPGIYITEHAPDGRVLHRVSYGYGYMEKAVIRHDVQEVGASYKPLSVIRLAEGTIKAMAASLDTLGQFENAHANAELGYEFGANDRPISRQEFILIDDLLRTSKLYAFDA